MSFSWVESGSWEEYGGASRHTFQGRMTPTAPPWDARLDHLTGVRSVSLLHCTVTVSPFLLFSFEESHQVQPACIFSVSDHQYLKLVRLLKDTNLVFHVAAVGWHGVATSPLDTYLALQVTTVPLSPLHSFQWPAWALQTLEFETLTLGHLPIAGCTWPA